jgi:hypothetical protein
MTQMVEGLPSKKKKKKKKETSSWLTNRAQPLVSLHGASDGSLPSHLPGSGGTSSLFMWQFS